MRAFTVLTAVVAPLDRANVDTDQIIPKQFLKSIFRTGFGVHLFDEWRYLDEGVLGQDCAKRPLNHDFVLNQPAFSEAQILLARRNFGCGSSREHAPWALVEYGFSCVIAPSFADIFYNNCFKNGILPVTLSEDQVEALFGQVREKPGAAFTVDLAQQVIIDAHGKIITFDIDASRKHCLLQGLDEIGLSLQYQAKIQSFEAVLSQKKPWIFNSLAD